ncbi:MAG: bacillithiol system redox-active protein YtxJ [Bacteroidota bacterium]
MPINWKNITQLEELELISVQSHKVPVIIFKHSTRCNISAVAKNRLDVNNTANDEEYYYLDLLSYRDISTAIAQRFQVNHESPQLLLIVDGECVYEESHMGINFAELAEQISQHKKIKSS